VALSVEPGLSPLEEDDFWQDIKMSRLRVAGMAVRIRYCVLIRETPMAWINCLCKC